MEAKDPKALASLDRKVSRANLVPNQKYS